MLGGLPNVVLHVLLLVSDLEIAARRHHVLIKNETHVPTANPNLSFYLCILVTLICVGTNLKRRLQCEALEIPRCGRIISALHVLGQQK